MFKIGSVNKKFNKETETFRYSFHLTHKGDPIFLKSFDGADPDKVLIGSDTVVLKNHFFTTGEELYYFADGSSIGIDHTSSGVGAATTYGRRYLLSAICGVAEQDDDGNAAIKR